MWRETLHRPDTAIPVMKWYCNINLKWKSRARSLKSVECTLVQMKAGFSLFLIRDTDKHVRNSNAYWKPQGLNSQSCSNLQSWAAGVRPGSLGSLVLLCCFGGRWKYHKWFSSTSQSDFCDWENHAVTYWLVTDSDISFTVQHLSKNVWFEFISNRH